MEKEAKEFPRDKYLKVEAVKALFPLPFTTKPISSRIANNPQALAALSQPLLEFKLENDEKFRMSGIPSTIAAEIQQLLEIEKSGKKVERKDPRMPLSALVGEITKIKRVEISEILPELKVYAAEISFTVNDQSGESLRSLTMIPSHAVLAAIRDSASIYVAKKLLRAENYSMLEKAREKQEQEEQKEEDRETDYYYI